METIGQREMAALLEERYRRWDSNPHEVALNGF